AIVCVCNTIIIMLKENWRFISRLERLGDNLIIVVCFFIAYYGRASLLYWDRKLQWNLPFSGEELAPLNEYLVVLVVALVAYSIFLDFMGAYGSMRLSSPFHLFRISLSASLL